MFKKKFQEREQKFRPNPETYRPDTDQQDKKDKTEDEESLHDEPEYDFFSRQREIEMSKDFRKLKEQSKFIPEDVGRGGFDEVVYWSQNAQTPDQIFEMVRVFNRVEIPEEPADELRFQEFGAKVLESVFLAPNLNILKEFAVFGQKYSISDALYWRKIEEKTMKLNPVSAAEIQDCSDIVFTLSKCGEGEMIFSHMVVNFKKMGLSTNDAAKLFVTYYNLQDGDKELIDTLFKKIIGDLQSLPKELLIEMLPTFKAMKNLSSEQEQIIFSDIEARLAEFSLKELCIAGEYIGYDRMPSTFWDKMEKRAGILLKGTKFNRRVGIWLIDLLSSYSLSQDFVRRYFLSELTKNNCKMIYAYAPEVLSKISKLLYIYEMEAESEAVDELIQTLIIKQYNNLKNVEPRHLLEVIKDFSITRRGSRELYIFLEEVTLAKFEDFKKDRKLLQALHAVYEKSNLCTADTLEKIEFYLE